MSAATAIQPQADELARCLTAAREAGMAREQISRFLKAGYVPQPKQMQFHAAARQADHSFGPTLIAMGGARGPGKSHASIEQAAVDDCQRVPGLKVLFLRKVGKAARESFSDLRRKTLEHVAHDYREYSGLLLFPNNSMILVGNFLREDDIDKYLGIEYDLIVIEEATQLSEEKFTKLRGSLRTSKQNWRPRMYLTTNPGGIGHQWFKRLFVMPWRKAQAGRGIETDTRFIPANYKDNKFLNKEYIVYLLTLTGVLGRMWRDGDWDVGAGQFFTNWDHDRHVIRPFNQGVIPAHWPLWASLDYGFTHPTAIYWHTKLEGVVYTVAEHVANRWLPQQHAAEIVRITRKLGREVEDLNAFVAGPDVFAQRGDSSGKTIAQQYDELGIFLTLANTNRVAGAAEMLRRLGNAEANIQPTWFIWDSCPWLIETIPAMQNDPNRVEDVLKVDADPEGKNGDDTYDSARYGLMEEVSMEGDGVILNY
ncbi:MAG: hypothetical protein IT327_06225 [Anaerolineae bacterium]|nr:hypothetical protein [Anaerolineae bacterium]